MEKALRKLARQLDVYDEASLTALWDKLARQVENFEPTKEWEESVLMLGMVQALRWKNQLFNYNWSENLKMKSLLKTKKGQENPWPEFSLEEPADLQDSSIGSPSHSGGPKGAGAREKRGKVLSFGSIKNDDSV